MKKMLRFFLLLVLLLTACSAQPAAPVDAVLEQETVQELPEAEPAPEQEAVQMLPEVEPAPETPAAEEPTEISAAEEVPTLEQRIDSASPALQSLAVNGEALSGFRPELRTYEIHIPAGRPQVPQLSAEAAQGSTVTLQQAVIPDSRSYGTAHVAVTDQNGNTGEYEILFVKDSLEGFQLQYLDRYPYQPDVTLGAGETLSFESSNPGVIEVESDGTLIAVGRSNAPVTITAKVNGTVADTLTVDCVVDAVVNLFLITGQSNAAGTLDIPAGMTEEAYIAMEMEDVLCPAPGTAFCIDVNIVGDILKPMYDLSEGRIGFSPALAKTWYDLTGEKVVVLQTAVGGSPIEAWMKPSDGQRNTYLYPQANFYETTLKAYQYCINSIGYSGSGYQINHTFAYWLQGETGTANTYNPNKISQGVGSTAHLLSCGEYYHIFLQNMEYFRSELNTEFMGILLVRNLEDASTPESIAFQLLTDLTGPRAAQYALNNTGIPDVGLVSRVSEYARKESYSNRSIEGWGFMGCNNVHYNQEGHNANGIAAAENTFGRFYGWGNRAAEQLQWYRQNGRDLFSDGDTLKLKTGEGYQTSAIVLPMYTDTPAVTYSAADLNICTVDCFGCITAVSAGTTTVTVSCEGAALARTITVTVEPAA